MAKFKVDDVFKYEDVEYLVLELYFHGYVVRRVDSTHGIDRTFLYDDEPDMHLVEDE